MSSSSTSPLLIAITFAFLLKYSLGADPLFHFCSSPENFTENGPYATNLDKLTNNLYTQAPWTGFARASFGQHPDTVHGLALCRGDASNPDCKSCLADAKTEIRNRCPYNKASIIWYDNCLLKYSNKNFFGQIDDQNKFYMWNVRSVSYPETFNARTKDLLTQLAKKAQYAPNLYATGETKLEGSQKLYGLVQCTRDLSNVDCARCLSGIIGELSGCCDGKEGGRVVSGSCNFRYEIYPFVNKA